MSGSRLDKPNPRSYLSAACWIDETLQHLAYSPESRAAGPAEQFFAAQDEARHQLMVKVASSRIGNILGRTVENSPEGQALAREFGAALHAAAPDRSPHIAAPYLGDGWKPKRGTAINIAIGAFLNAPANQRTDRAVAKYLSAGVPRNKPGVTADHVRHARESFAKAHWSELNMVTGDVTVLEIRCVFLALTERRLRAQWDRLVKAAPSDSVSLHLARQGCRDGSVFRHGMEIDSAVGGPTLSDMNSPFAVLARDCVKYLEAVARFRGLPVASRSVG